MRIAHFFLGLLLALALPNWAQEGHPLTGSWHGEWHPAAGKRVPILLFLKWDSKAVIGTINPGPNAVPLKVATLDAANWTVHFEADAKDGSHIVIDGKLDNIGSYNRTITGTWSEGSARGDCKFTRD
ncbi:MAG TPA: hypothetical protein VLY24_03030 [Bryobacteraceae bacterium]|nr:hypothetical protein [Bryobacteraceae bacterium]